LPIVDGSRNLRSCLIVRNRGSADLAAQFWISKWRVPGRIEEGVYGALLCIDPNGVRITNPGPLIFVLDSLMVRPGLTDRAGVMQASINDNANADIHPQAPRGKMELLEEDTIWIRDGDEFWVGFQRGPDAGGNEPEGGWDSENEVGRKWVMGGYINERSYSYSDREVTATITGRDYMEVWNNQFFGMPEQPRNYTTPTDISVIVDDLISDINAFQPAGWQYTKHPTLFPASSPLALDVGFSDTAAVVEDAGAFLAGEARIHDDSDPEGEIITIDTVSVLTNQLDFIATPIQNAAGYTVANNGSITQLMGTEWLKDFKKEIASQVMENMCAELVYEWRIDYRKRVLFYPRALGPIPSISSPAYSIKYSTNLKEISKLCMGDTTEKITHVIVTDAETTDMPPDIDAWCMSPNMWPDLSNPVRGYSAASYPAPCNPKVGTYVDTSLIMDDENHPAICIQNDSNSHFNLNLSFFYSGGIGTFASLHLDCREYRRLKFKFRHATRVGTGNSYQIQIRNDLNVGYRYYFGRGAALSPQLLNGDTEYDTIDSDRWSKIDLLLPELDIDGNVIELHGWQAVTGSEDPTDISFVSIDVIAAEPDPGYGPGQNTLAAVVAGWEYLRVPNPELFAGFNTWGGGARRFWQESVCQLVRGAVEEEVCIQGTQLASIPGFDNIQLTKGLNNAFGNTATLRLKGGWTIGFSQLHFERNLQYLTEAAAITPPYRYRMAVAKEMEKLNEAQVHAESIIEQETVTKQYVDLSVYGNPEFTIGGRVKAYLGKAPFENANLVVDDIEYTLGADLDFQITLTLGITAQKQRELNEFNVMGQQETRLRNLSLGTSELRIKR